MKNNLEKDIRMALDKGRENWVKFINSLDDRKIVKFYCNLYNCRTGSNYADEYIINGKSTEAIRSELLDMDYAIDAIERLAKAIEDYKNEDSNYSSVIY